MTPDILGFIAATLTTFAFVPQAYKVYKTKQTADLSLALFVLFSVGVALWLIYGILIKSGPVIASNSLTLLLSCYILYMKLKKG